MLTIAHEPEKRGESADVHAISTDRNEMGGDTIELCHQHAYILDAFRNLMFNAQHPLNAHGIRMFTVHGRDIIQPIYKGNDLIVWEVFAMFLKTTVQVPDMWNYFFNNFSIHQNFQSQHAV